MQQPVRQLAYLMHSTFNRPRQIDAECVQFDADVAHHDVFRFHVAG